MFSLQFLYLPLSFLLFIHSFPYCYGLKSFDRAGRSPRMQYHAQCFADVNSVERVTILGYKGEKCISSLENAAKTKRKGKIVLDRFTQFEAPLFLVKSTFLRQVFKALAMLLHLLYKFMTLPKYDVVIIQNPPCLPVLLAAIVVYILSGFRFQIWLDWHNLGFTMFERGSLASKISKVLERRLSWMAHRHFCVSKTMKEWLSTTFNVDAIVLYDRPTRRFIGGGDDADANGTPRRSPRRSSRDTSSSSSSYLPSYMSQYMISVRQRHELFVRLKLHDANIFKHGSKENDSNEHSKTTIQTYVDENSTYHMRTDACRILLSSTSWTEDEDFSLLLDALIKVNKKLEMNVKKCEPGAFEANRLLCIITGKGPLKEAFLEQYRQIESSLSRVSIITPWLEPEDYPLLVKCADIGVCLHTSTSGLDLPMKVLDMFGAGLAVVALDYPAISELIKSNENGLLFDEDLSVDDNVDKKNSKEKVPLRKRTHKDDLQINNYGNKENSNAKTLYDCLDKLLCIPTSELKMNRLRMTVIKNSRTNLTWEQLWKQTMEQYRLLGKTEGSITKRK